jgi:hypothetical protein
MIRSTDKETIDGPMVNASDPNHCARCEQELYYECTNCRTILGNTEPDNGDGCPDCSATTWAGPRCICNVGDCGED